MNPSVSRQRYNAHSGFTLVELMVAISIGVFLAAGLLTLLGAMKRTVISQSGLSQLQDDERMAMTLINDVIQSAGYFPQPVNPPLVISATALLATPPFTQAGQSIFGTGSFNDVPPTPGNTITVRYLTSGLPTPPGDGILDCTGNASAIAATIVNTYSVDTNGNLLCTLQINGGAATTVKLVSNVTRMQVLYGYHSNTGVNNASVDTYLDATAITAAAAWSNVVSVKVTVTFTNPLRNQPGQPLTPIAFTRVIAVMNKTGAST